MQKTDAYTLVSIGPRYGLHSQLDVRKWGHRVRSNSVNGSRARRTSGVYSLRVAGGRLVQVDAVSVAFTRFWIPLDDYGIQSEEPVRAGELATGSATQRSYCKMRIWSGGKYAVHREMLRDRSPARRVLICLS